MSWPNLPPRVPRAGNLLTRGLCRALMGMAGWKVTLKGFPDEPKMLVVVAPHTSNWDWILGILTIFGLGLKVTWLGKHTLFEGPFRWFFYGLGGIPVNRGSAAGIVGQVIKGYEQREQMVVGLAPEGTRHKVTRFRTGYHRIAKGANVPLVLAAFDYPSKTVSLGETFSLTDDVEADTDRLQDWYQQFQGRRPSTKP